MTIKYYEDVEQGSDEWHRLRCGIMTASEMKLLVTEKEKKVAKNDKVRSHMYELLAQRITGYVEPTYIGDDMLRGKEDEVEARIQYEYHYGEVQQMGFITNDKWGFTIGYSPDGLIGDNGAIECKSRKQKLQLQTILSKAVPDEHIIQVQTGLLVSERDYIDYISYCGGMHMFTLRVEPDKELQAVIIEAAEKFEEDVVKNMAIYKEILADKANRLIPTTRKTELEIKI